MMGTTHAGAFEQMAQPIQHSSAAATQHAQADAFVNVLDGLLGLGRQDHAHEHDRVFTTAAGSRFTLKTEQTDIGFLVRPEIQMPVMAADLSGQMVLRLLAVQSLLMSEMNWWLSACETGQLQLSPIQWHDEPSHVAACIELAAALIPSIHGFIFSGQPMQSP
jgi:hypothetical protein